MTARAPAAAKNTAKGSPFEQITQREDQEEKRLHEALERLQQEKLDAEKGMLDAENHAEEKLREEAKKRLSESKTEIGSDLEKSEKAVKSELKDLEATYKKNAPALIKKVIDSLLSPAK